MKYQAVIFDLFGTLVDRMVHPESNALRGRQVVIAMANTLGAPYDDFLRLWRETMLQRDSGEFQTTEAALTYLLHEPTAIWSPGHRAKSSASRSALAP